MNDFSKEELVMLKRLTLQDVNQFRQNSDCIELMHKVKTMIDNYCEHENKCDHDWSVGFGSIHSPVTYCKKCSCQKPLVPDDVFKMLIEY